MLMQASVTDTPWRSGWPATMSWRPSSRWLSIITPVMRCSPAAICCHLGRHLDLAAVLLAAVGVRESIITCSRRPAERSGAQAASTSAAL
jgi:hypothetical protein